MGRASCALLQVCYPRARTLVTFPSRSLSVSVRSSDARSDSLIPPADPVERPLIKSLRDPRLGRELPPAEPRSAMVDASALSGDGASELSFTAGDGAEPASEGLSVISFSCWPLPGTASATTSHFLATAAGGGGGASRGFAACGVRCRGENVWTDKSYVLGPQDSILERLGKRGVLH